MGFILKERKLVDLQGRFLRRLPGLIPLGRDLLIELIDGQHEGRGLFPADLFGRLQLLLAQLGVIGPGDHHRLTGGRHQQIHQLLLILGIIKQSAVHAKRRLPVFLHHKGQKLSKLRQKSLLVNFGHLRLLRTGPRADCPLWQIVSIISSSPRKVKGNREKCPDSALDKEKKREYNKLPDIFSQLDRRA